jgi:predicted transposase YbfD/YdcC
MFDATPVLENLQKDWPYIRSIIKVTRYREVIGQKASEEVSYYVTNKKLRIEEIAKYIRDHWHIENKLHHVKDTAFMEDCTVKRVNPAIFSISIDIALNIMRKNKEFNITGTMHGNCMNFKKHYQKCSIQF